MINAIKIFDKNAHRYDSWYIKHWYAYQSELIALRSILPKFNHGIEIGAGTGRFALPLGIHIGVEPAQAMAHIAQQRGLSTINATAENLPFPPQSFDLALIVVSICFFSEPHSALKEVYRILTPNGHLIIGVIPANSLVGNFYLTNKIPPFYTYARFFTVKDMMTMLNETGFIIKTMVQTLFDFPWMLSKEDPTLKGHTIGSFVAMHAIKI
ncbi:MAG: class I SAM-dependent methyltransferase [Chlorobi bacterium]|nr:class I SAM-dependent methyltransferase [Chlorobiota bacterium]